MLASSSLVASNGCCPPSLVLYQEQAFQELAPLWSTLRARPDIVRQSNSLTSDEPNDLVKCRSALYGYSEFVKGMSKRMPLIVNEQDEQWIKYHEIMQFLGSRSSGLKELYLDASVFPDIRGLEDRTPDMNLHSISSGIGFSSRFPQNMSFLQESESDPSIMSAQPDWILSGNMNDMKELASVLAEFRMTKDTDRWRKQQLLVPHFKWSDAVEVQDLMYPDCLELETLIVAPLKSPEKVRQKSASKRKNKKGVRERDMYRNNSLHACESLLSLMMDKNRSGKSVLNSLKKSGPELPELLTQFSATIAGTGLAVMFSVVYKVVCGNISSLTPHLLTSAFGVGLFWLAWAVTRLRNNIMYINKNSSKAGFQEEDVMMRVDRSVKDIYFRAAASMAVLMLRFA